MYHNLLALLLIVAGSNSTFAQGDKKPPSPALEKAIAAVQKHLDERGGRGAMILWKEEKAVASTFPNHSFVLARFRIYPVARELPEGMKPSNIFAVSGEGKLEPIRDTKALERFFQAHAQKVDSETVAAKALETWLTLSQEFHQDGFYKFEVLSKEFSIAKKDGEIEARGRAFVVGGGNGEIASTLAFDGGKLISAKESSKIQEGPRPICQATKLLDVDPIVRKMAERDLIFMGTAAHDYLMEQRAKAAPELRDAIDTIWRQIQKNGW